MRLISAVKVKTRAAELYEVRRMSGKNETVSPVKLSNMQKTPLEVIEKMMKTKGILSKPE
ncbi:MAG: hypothetical protein AMXMBFR48_08540 [Ignavibacteriales bacterium]